MIQAPIAAILLFQVAATFEYQGSWSVRTLSGVHTATRYDTIVCNQSVQPRTLQGLQVLTEVRHHVTYLTQGEVQIWINDQQKIEMSIYRVAGYGLAGSGFVLTSVIAGGVAKIKENWVKASVPTATAVIGSATVWWKNNPPQPLSLPSNMLPAFVQLAPMGQVGSCQNFTLFAQPQQNEQTFEFTIP